MVPKVDIYIYIYIYIWWIKRNILIKRGTSRKHPNVYRRSIGLSKYISKYKALENYKSIDYIISYHKFLFNRT